MAKLVDRASSRSGIRFEEALALSALLLPELPLPPRIGLHVPGIPGIVRVALDGAADADDALTFDADEWRAIATAAVADRLWPLDFRAFCARKSSEPAFRLDAETALAGAQPEVGVDWTAREVLARIGARVVSVELG